MSYKDIIKSRKMRLAILKCFSFIPDKSMIKLQYRIKLHRKLDLVNPRRFTEKLQWYKIYYRDLLMQQCVDKYEVRKYVEECGLSEILIPIVGVYDDVRDIKIEELPEQFVAKDTLGGGGNSVIICNNKENLKEDFLSILNKWTHSSTSYRQGGREWVYGGRKHRIILEQLLPSKAEDGGLIDYKFFCFNGKPEYLYVLADRKVGDKAGLGVFKADTYEKFNVVRCDEKPLERVVEKPQVYDKMYEIAQILSRPFPESRIDLYCIDNKVYFGEITFFDGSGYMKFDPDEFDFTMGDKFILPERNN